MIWCNACRDHPFYRVASVFMLFLPIPECPQTQKCQIFGRFSPGNAFCCDFFVIVLAGFDNFASTFVILNITKND